MPCIKLSSGKTVCFEGNKYPDGDGNTSKFDLGGEVEKQKQWLISYVKSPMYKERLKQEFPGKDDAFINAEAQARLNNLLSAKINYVNAIGEKPGYVSGAYVPKNYQGLNFNLQNNSWQPNKFIPSKFTKGNVYFEQEFKPSNWNPYRGYETIPLHEFGHVLDDGGFRIPKSTQNKIFNYTTRPTEDYQKNYMNSSGQVFTYESTPSEFINRIQPIRYLLNDQNIYDARKSKFTEQDYIKMMNNPKIKENEHFKDVMDSLKGDANQKKKAFIDIMNTVAMQNEGNLEPIADSGIKVQLQDPPKFTLGGETTDTEWMGNKLDKQGFITSSTKGGNRISFTGNASSDEWINKQIDTGKFGYNPKTGTVVKLDTPVQGLSKEDQIRGTKEFARATMSGFPNKEEIVKLPKEQQNLINKVNEQKAKDLVVAQNNAALKNPATYAPGALFFGGIAAPYVTAGIEGATAAIEGVPALAEGLETANAAYKGYQVVDKSIDAGKNISEGNYAGAAGNILDVGKSFIPVDKLTKGAEFAWDATSGALSGFGNTGTLEGTVRGSFDNTVGDRSAQKIVGNKDSIIPKLIKKEIMKGEESLDPSVRFNNGGYIKYGEGGKNTNMKNGINNPGFKSLPGFVQQKIVANMEMGGIAMPGEDDKIVKKGAPTSTPPVKEATPKQLSSQQIANLATTFFSRDPSMQTPLPNFLGSYRLTDEDKTLMFEGMKRMKSTQAANGIYAPVTAEMIDQLKPMLEKNRSIDYGREMQEVGGMNTNDPTMSITDPDYEQMMLQYGGMVEDLDGSQVIQKFGKGGGITYRGHKFPGYNKPIKAPASDKHKKMVLVKKGDKIRLIKFGYSPKNKVSKSAKKDLFSPSYWSSK